MGIISKITIKDRVWNQKTEKYETVVHNYDRSQTSEDIDELALEHIPNSDIQDYAENELGLIEEDDCDCEEKDIYDFDDREIIDYLEESGYMVFKCQTITDKMRLEKIKEALEV